MASLFAKVSEEEIVAINKNSIFYSSDSVKLILKQLSPSGSVKSGGYVAWRFASRYISTTIHLPLGG